MPEAQEATPAEGEKPEAQTPPKEGQTPTPEPEKAEGKTFDETYVKELRSEAAKNRKAAQAAAAKLQEIEDAQKSDLEKATTRADKAEARTAELEAETKRRRIAQEKGLPAELYQFLSATEDDELEKQADVLIENAKPKPTSMDGGVRENADQPKTPEEGHRDFLMNVFGKPTNT